MTPTTAAAAAAGALIGLGLALTLAGLHGRDVQDPPSPPWRTRARARISALAEAARGRWGEAVARRAGIAVLAVVAVGLVTRWPVGAVLAGLGTWSLPGLWRGDAIARAQTDRLEAIAVWTEMLRDTLSAAAGLEQAIRATAAMAPPALADPVATLAARIEDGDPLPTALHGFADDVDDPTADLVVSALVLASTRQARDLVALLSTLAQAARDQVVLRLRVAASRARIRTSVRIVLTVTLGMVTALVLLNRSYLRPYDSPEGQLVLLLVGGLFAAAFAWLHRIAAISPQPRILRPTTPASPVHPSGPVRPASPASATGRTGSTWGGGS